MLRSGACGTVGAVPRFLDLFNIRAPTMQVTDRDGDSEFEDVKWRKPVAMLVNGGTRSGKEVLAYGFKKYRLGEVIGTRSRRRTSKQPSKPPPSVSVSPPCSSHLWRCARRGRRPER